MTIHLKFNKLLLILIFLSLVGFLFSQSYYDLSLKKIPLINEKGKTLFPGNSTLAEAGAPLLPYYSVTFLIPAYADEKSVKIKLIDLQEEIMPGFYNIDASAGPMTSNGEKAMFQNQYIVNGRDIRIYGINDYYPAGYISQINFGRMQQYKLVEVTVKPYRYNPISQKLIRIESGRLMLDFNPAGKPQNNASIDTDNHIEKLRSLVVNPEVLSTYNTRTNTDAMFSMLPPVTGSSNYIILTTTTYKNNSSALNYFINSKTALGYHVTVVTEDQWGGGTGDNAAENIRNWLKANYLSINIGYLLLIGNPDPVKGDVPMKLTWPKYETDPTIESYDVPTDYYYAELSGNWDLNNDGIYGQSEVDTLSGGLDRYPEIIVGRIPVYDYDFVTLDRILIKTIAYENETDISWRKHDLIPMKAMNDNNFGDQIGELIKDEILIPNNFSWHRVYDYLNPFTAEPIPHVVELDPQPETLGVNINNVISAWNKKPVGITAFISHGWSTGASYILNSSSTINLNNQYPSITFEGSCSNAYPEVSDNLSYSMLKNGAVSAVGATRLSWYSSETYIHTILIHGFAYQYTEKLVADKMTTGQAINWVRTNGGSIDGGGQFPYWMNLLGFNIYGDPSIGLYSNNNNPETLPVAFAGVDQLGVMPDDDGYADYATIILNGAGSYNTGGDIIQYEWYNNTTHQLLATGIITYIKLPTNPDDSYQFKNYEILLRVINDKGLSAVDTMKVSLYPQRIKRTAINLDPANLYYHYDLTAYDKVWHWNSSDSSSSRSLDIEIGEIDSTDNSQYAIRTFSADSDSNLSENVIFNLWNGELEIDGNNTESDTYSYTLKPPAINNNSDKNKYLEQLKRIVDRLEAMRAPVYSGNYYFYPAPELDETITYLNASIDETEKQSENNSYNNIVKVQYRSLRNSKDANQISYEIKIINIGNKTVNLSDINVRYYYKNELNKSQSVSVYWSQVGSQNVNAKTVSVSGFTEADYAIDISFKTDAGTLPFGGAINVILGVNYSDWSSYDQSNDYSFNPEFVELTDWNKINGYVANQLIWGNSVK